MKQLFQLDGKIAVVTGGGRGLGRAAATGLAQFGAQVAILDVLRDEMDDTVGQIQSNGGIAQGFPCDVSDEDNVRQVAEQIDAEHGRVDILVNIAGITHREATTQISSDTVRRLTEVNYFGMFWCCQHFGKIMVRQSSGSIINMSALGGGILGTGRGNAAYSSTKGAAASLTKELATEWGPYGIRVNAVAPCWFKTDMNTGSIFQMPNFMDQVMSKLPMRRIGEPDDLIGPIVFLASDASRMITGHVLPVDGGAASCCPITMDQ